MDYFNYWFPITPSDTVDITVRHKGIYVGAGGQLTIVDGRNTPTTMTVVTGAFLPFQVRRINATGTDATGLIGLGHV